MLRVLLDTNTAIFVIRQRPPQALAVFTWHAGRMALTAITLAELMHGAEESSRPTTNLAVVEDFCSRLDVLPYGPKAAQYHGQIRAAQQVEGSPIGVNDPCPIPLRLAGRGAVVSRPGLACRSGYGGEADCPSNDSTSR